MNPFSVLPSDITRRILRDPVLVHEDTVAVSQTCQRLRSIVLSTPQLWNSLAVLSPKRSISYPRLIIERSQPAPLQLALAVACLPEPPEWTSTCCELLSDNLPRIERLTLITELYGLPPTPEGDEWGRPWPRDEARLVGQLHPSQWSQICHALGTPARLLRRLILYRTVFMPSRPLVLRADLFGGEAPLLRSCVLSGVSLPRGCAAFKNLVSLHYHAWNAAPALHLDEIYSMLDDLPELKMLCLKDHRFADYTAATDHPRPLVPAFRSGLNAMRMFDVRPGSLPFVRVRDFFHGIGVRRFEFQHSGMLADFPTLETIMEEYPRIATLSARPQYVELHAPDSDTTLHIRRAFWDASFLLEEPRAFAHLRRLTINEYFWPQDDALPPAPHLEALCVVLGSCSDYRMFARLFSDGTCSIFHSERSWACPALRSVHLAYEPPRERSCARRHAGYTDPAAWCSCAGALTVSLRDAHRFAKTCLQFDAPRLALFKMSGVEPVDPNERAPLDEIADIVEISATVDQAAIAQSEWHSCTDFELRALLLDCPYFWNKKRILKTGANLSFERHIIRRSDPAPLDMHVFISPWSNSQARDCWELVHENIRRLSGLTLVMEQFVLFNEQYMNTTPHHAATRRQPNAVAEPWGRFCGALDPPAPLLERFVFDRQTYGDIQHSDLPEHLFSGEAPRLRFCLLKGVMLPSQPIKAFANLVSFHYCAVPHTTELHMWLLDGILAGLPSLETLTLQGHSFVLDQDFGVGFPQSSQAAAGGGRSPSILRTVRILNVRSPYTDFMAPWRTWTLGPSTAWHAFFRAWGVTPFECTDSATSSPDDFGAPTNILLAYPTVESVKVILPHFELQSGSTTVVVFRECWHLEFFASNPLLYAHLQHLTINEWYWPKEGALRDGLHVETLCIILASRQDFATFAAFFRGPIGCSLFQAEGAWSCPALRAVHLKYTGVRIVSPQAIGCDVGLPHSPPQRYSADVEALPISLRETRRFVAMCLNFSRNRLVALELSGVDPVDPDAWELLYAVAEDVRISSIVDRALVDRVV
ncbi:hypothetical protein AURDEDRAFT_172980 [Auricularia subglabra TFB-10046 SS5]|uniref:Uncharacterized protein n=1 Tax=Auricularia subglabra (strain TFB-10046 / SS5) TaxID=717982 RepID=J0DBK2_AURST|nr:hypothetical protein AURDEDRAFT_172980 [Auricularia subglabra TFB-10046 SS5]